MRTRLASLALAVFGAVANACATSDPTDAVLDNDYAADTDGSGVTVYSGWWSVATFLDPVPPGQESRPVRVVQGTDYGYALLARAWTPGSGSPVDLVPVRSRGELFVERGDTLHFRVSPTSVDGDCATGVPLSQADADFITQRIFPGAFAGVTYDAATCSSTLLDGETGGAGSPSTP